MYKPLNSLGFSPRIITMNLKRQLFLYLEARELSASQLARKAGVPKQTISGFLAGSIPRDPRQVKKIAEVLGTTIDNLLFGEGIEQKSQSISNLGALVGDEWMGGVFEVRFRRVRGLDRK